MLTDAASGNGARVQGALQCATGALSRPQQSRSSAGFASDSRQRRKEGALRAAGRYCVLRTGASNAYVRSEYGEYPDLFERLLAEPVRWDTMFRDTDLVLNAGFRLFGHWAARWWVWQQTWSRRHGFLARVRVFDGVLVHEQLIILVERVLTAANRARHGSASTASWASCLTPIAAWASTTASSSQARGTTRTATSAGLKISGHTSGTWLKTGSVCWAFASAISLWQTRLAVPRAARRSACRWAFER